MIARSLILSAALAAGLSGGALAADKPSAKSTGHDCFLSSQWQGWKAPDENTIYLRINVRDIYRVDLSAGSTLLKWPDTRLDSVEHGSSYICSPLDLQLTVAENGGGAREPIIAKAITKLTPEQIAAIPKKDLP